MHRMLSRKLRGLPSVSSAGHTWRQSEHQLVMVPFCFEANNKPRAKIATEVIYCFYKIGV